MNSGGYDTSLANMGRGRLIQQKDSTRIKQCWMDYLLYQDRPETDKHLLGEVNRGTVVSRENDRPMRFTPIGTGGGRVLQGEKGQPSSAAATNVPLNSPLTTDDT